jgi:hypothetical protein
MVVGFVAAPLAFAESGGIGNIKLEPAGAKVGQAVKVTVDADGDAPAFCGMGLDFGDGEVRDLKIEANDGGLPRTESKTYAKPGNYTIKAFGKKVTTHLPCKGKSEARLAVAGAAPAAEPKAVGPACPAGYKMQGKVGKAGNFTCKAGKGAKAPEKMLECANGLEYFQSKSSLGCRKAR